MIIAAVVIISHVTHGQPPPKSTPESSRQLGTQLAVASGNVPRRRYIAFLTYGVLVFQSGFDGLVLKYNPNGQDSAVQVAMFFLTKVIESVVVSTALIHSGIRSGYYILYMCNFTATGWGSFSLCDVELGLRMFSDKSLLKLP